MPTIPRCRCWIPAVARPRPAGCGATCAMTARSAAQAPPAVLYRYSPDRKGEHPRTHLAGFRGILQADGYTGYAGLYQRGVTEAACMAHAGGSSSTCMRPQGSPLALEALQRIAALYADRGNDPRPVARGPPGGSQRTERAVVQRLAELAGDRP